MTSCCTANERGERAPELCVVCGAKGQGVELITLKALLRPGALERLTTEGYFFCRSPSCDVVYFSPSSVFRRADVLVPVFQKCVAGSRTVCYCLDIGEDQVRCEVETTGASASSERIRALVQRAGCACELRNPQGTCCLGNVSAVVKAAQRLGVP